MIMVLAVYVLGLFLIYLGLTSIHSSLGMIFVGFLIIYYFERKGGE